MVSDKNDVMERELNKLRRESESRLKEVKDDNAKLLKDVEILQKRDDVEVSISSRGLKLEYSFILNYFVSIESAPFISLKTKMVTYAYVKHDINCIQSSRCLGYFRVLATHFLDHY